MNLFRSYGLTLEHGLEGVVVSVPWNIQEYLMETQNHQPTGDVGELFGLQYESHRGIAREGYGYTVCLDNAARQEGLGVMQLRGLAKLLEALNQVSSGVRLNKTQLVTIALYEYEPGRFTIDATLHEDLFKWCVGNLHEESALSGDVRTASAKIWQAITGSEFGQRPEEHFLCSASRNYLGLGCSGGNFMATFSPPNNACSKLDAHNITDCPALAPLLIYQLAYIEDLYRSYEAGPDVA